MALTFHTFKFLEKLKHENHAFGRTLSIGRLNNLIKKDEFIKLNISFSDELYADKILFNNFNLLSLNALDYSAFEEADIVHDLNKPIINVEKQFDTVLDFGTSEHVFDISQCLKNISSLCKIEGIIIHCLPANNNCGHGFWQFSPEVFFNIYSKKNGFCDTEIILINLFDRKYWYEVKRQEKGERLEINSAEPLYLLIKTKKIGQADYDKINQSDYEHQWSNLEENKKIKKSFSSILNKKIKDSFKSALRNNIITKKYYNNFENYKLHKKNNFKNNKNLKKTLI
tara:strand:+ start:3168 stop:4019 length:852 start_codon:yes stop_codon:yes gene_type:complete